MKNTLRRIVAGAALVIMASNPGHADDDPYLIAVTPVAGVYFPGGVGNLKSGPLLGMRVAIPVANLFDLEGSLGFVSTKNDGGTANLSLFSLQALYGLTARRDFTSFLTIGVGGVWSAEEETGPMVNFGAGAMYFTRKDLALRCELRDVMTVRSLSNNLEFTLGVSYFFGAKSRESVVSPLLREESPGAPPLAPTPVIPPPAQAPAPAPESPKKEVPPVSTLPAGPAPVAAPVAAGKRTPATPAPSPAEPEKAAAPAEPVPVPKPVATRKAAPPVISVAPVAGGVEKAVLIVPSVPAEAEKAVPAITLVVSAPSEAEQALPAEPVAVQKEAPAAPSAAWPVPSPVETAAAAPAAPPVAPAPVEAEKALPAAPVAPAPVAGAEEKTVPAAVIAAPAQPEAEKAEVLPGKEFPLLQALLIPEQEPSIRGLERSGTRLKNVVTVRFAPGKTSLDALSRARLEGAARLAKSDPRVRIRLSAHTDNLGNAHANYLLSRKRASSVKNYLVRVLGVNPQSITAKGYGRYQPVADNSTAAGRKENRRTVTIVFETDELR
jgi:outer membrane protein OmpA-like peptidoglycan-associated protein